jgi:ATP phosphoribosyltransferase regulatory subunit
MDLKLLHTPEGVRDIYNIECEKKLKVQELIHERLKSFGFQDIQTPMFEFFDVFGKDMGTVSSRELYKFFDREGNTLVLRPDITPSIARAAATLFEENDLPVRLCYTGNTFVNYTSYQGRMKEITQTGAELIGDDSEDADAEMLAIVAESLKAVGLNDFQINIGHTGFFRSLMESVQADEETMEQIRDLIGNRNFYGVEEILYSIQASPEIIRAFGALPDLTGDEEVLEQAMDIAEGIGATDAIVRLQKIYAILKTYGVEKNISFDLSMSGNYGYYTGIIFRAYTFGTGDAIVRGGRYDHLLSKFGKNAPSIGFAIVVDRLMDALNRQKIHVPMNYRNCMIVYEPAYVTQAVDLAQNYRRQLIHTEMLRKDPEHTLEHYETMAKNRNIDTVIYVEDDKNIHTV